MNRRLAIVVSLLAAACSSASRSGDSPTLSSLLLPTEAASGPCSLSAVNPHAMAVYPSNPHLSADETFLDVTSVMGGESFPRGQLTEAGVAFYGVPRTEAGINLYRFTDEAAAAVAARVLSNTFPRQQGIFQKGVVVAVAWQAVEGDPKCLVPVLRHLERAMK